jgi:hypothetical protein
MTEKSAGEAYKSAGEAREIKSVGHLAAWFHGRPSLGVFISSQF